jgi:hypothetical protein
VVRLKALVGTYGALFGFTIFKLSYFYLAFEVLRRPALNAYQPSFAMENGWC